MDMSYNKEVIPKGVAQFGTNNASTSGNEPNPMLKELVQ